MKIKFYGVRGSYPVPGKGTSRYGGNTTCVTIFNELPDGKIDRIIIDSGTGIIRLGREIMGNFFAKNEDLYIKILFTHLHPDHTQGFPFFAPNYFSDCRLDLLGMEALKMNVGEVLRQTMVPPTFPFEYKELRSEREHHVIKDGSVVKSPLGSMEIAVMQAFAPSHPQQGALFFKITDCACELEDGTRIIPENPKSIACIWDNESKQGGDKAVIKFSRDCDIMIHDTQYTREEYNSDEMIVQGFGHSTYDMAIENARQAGIKERLICTHFNPVHNDEKLDEIQEGFAHETPMITLAQEGMELDV